MRERECMKLPNVGQMCTQLDESMYNHPYVASSLQWLQLH